MNSWGEYYNDIETAGESIESFAHDVPGYRRLEEALVKFLGEPEFTGNQVELVDIGAGPFPVSSKSLRVHGVPTKWIDAGYDVARLRQQALHHVLQLGCKGNYGDSSFEFPPEEELYEAIQEKYGQVPQVTPGNLLDTQLTQPSVVVLCSVLNYLRADDVMNWLESQKSNIRGLAIANVHYAGVEKFPDLIVPEEHRRSASAWDEILTDPICFGFQDYGVHLKPMRVIVNGSAVNTFDYSAIYIPQIPE